MLLTFLALASLPFAAIPARAVQHAVTVGGPGILAYNPPFVTAAPGDTILFTFKQKNHTATQSSFASPCVTTEGGFDTGFQPVNDSNTAGPFPTAQLTVVDENPIWVYCRQANHCEQGMVFAVNPGDKFSAFQAAANGTASASSVSPPPASSTASTTTAPVVVNSSAPTVVTVTATITTNGQTLTTTYGSYPGSAAPTSGSSVSHMVTVGNAGALTFSPSEISAQPGDTVTFQFMAKNHTATQSSFKDPCRSLTSTSTTGQVGFDSGFMPVSANATQFPSFTISVNDTTPIWVYCRQDNPSSHCGAGMVFAVNAIDNGPNNFTAFQAMAKQLNGSTTASNSSESSATGTNGALPMQSSRGLSAALVLGALAFSMLL